jgi:S-DNA-T family DNA segregation ATPase FtsK/SpoIIIE
MMMPEPLIEVINKLGLWGTLGWLLLCYASLHALIHGRWPIPGEAVLRLLWRRYGDKRDFSPSPGLPQTWSYHTHDGDGETVDHDDPQETAMPVSDSVKWLSRQATRLEQLLHSFGIAAMVRNVAPGPVVTLFEIELGFGVSGKELNARTGDIARVLQVDQVRIRESLPGRTHIGIEVPNPQRKNVHLKQLSAALAEQEPLSIVLGVDTVGDPVIENLAAMPHLLVTGTTGSGKSVSVNAMLACLLERNDAHQLRLILIDPKALEFSLYEGIPHLLCPVVTDMRQASRALAWCIDEMERRYAAMAHLRVRHIGAYNRKIRDTGRVDEQLPNIVVVVDELADLMLTHAKAVEPLIQRLSQKARAAGIHLILATQRPTTNVVSGTIKANIRTRLTLALPTQTDSRTVLDHVGAEKLLDKGDALLMNHRGIHRIHCPFISDDEVAALTDRLRAEAVDDVEYVDILVSDEKTTIIELLPEAAAARPTLQTENRSDHSIGHEKNTGSGDDTQQILYTDAVHLVVDAQKATKTLLKKELGIGDKKADELLLQMEQNGVVGAAVGRARRRVLIDAVPPSLLAA